MTNVNDLPFDLRAKGRVLNFNQAKRGKKGRTIDPEVQKELGDPDDNYRKGETEDQLSPYHSWVMNAIKQAPPEATVIFKSYIELNGVWKNVICHAVRTEQGVVPLAVLIDKNMEKALRPQKPEEEEQKDDAE